MRRVLPSQSYYVQSESNAVSAFHKDINRDETDSLFIRSLDRIGIPGMPFAPTRNFRSA